MTHPLLELQAADTMADQLRHRREELAERVQVQAANPDLLRWNEARIVARKSIDELTETIETAEADSKQIDVQRDRLQNQLRQVIAPREAEALQHEIATLNERRGALDEKELEALEEHSRLETELDQLNAQEAALTEVYLTAEGALSKAEADIDGELERVAERLGDLRGAVDKKALRRYDSLRKNNVVAAATLSGSRCDGCHLDLSPAEVDKVRDAADKAGGVTDCPNCGRLLIIS